MESHCTFKETGTNYYAQNWAPCFDCFPSGNEGACIHCLNNCHQGHNIGQMRFSRFFCDCGYHNKCCKKAVETDPMQLVSDMPPIQLVPNSAIDMCRSINILAQKLFNTLEDNCVCSPLSITYIMTMLHLGSSGNTALQITNLLSIKNSLDDLITCSKIFNTNIIKLANAVLVNKNMPIKEEYLQMVRQLALVSNEDFGNSTMIVAKANKFIADNTNGLIKDILKEEMISTDTVMVLINTIYFKTVWDKPFKKIKTRKARFNFMFDIEMMTNSKNYPYYEDNNGQIVELPYKGKEFCMGIILPKIIMDIDSCANYLSKNVDCYAKHVEVHIPKFTQRKNMDLIPYMQQMGVTDIFYPATSKLGNMVAGAYVSTMIHEAVVIVDEAGTEAAAVTTAVCTLGCARMKPKPIIFNANRSFIYYIKHIPTNTLLFVGDFHGKQSN
jgi:serine protease inhibitor